jgi:hypothetical protein
VVTVTAYARSEPSPTQLGTIAYTLLETFVRRLKPQTKYMAFLPMHFYRHPNAGGWLTVFEGVEIETAALSCIRSVSLVSDFRSGDVLMDYFVPMDPSQLKRRDLFQRVFIPGFGYL